jgi:hypothetical protein
MLGPISLFARIVSRERMWWSSGPPGIEPAWCAVEFVFDLFAEVLEVCQGDQMKGLVVKVGWVGGCGGHWEEVMSW